MRIMKKGPKFQKRLAGIVGGGGSSIVKVPGDMPLARVCFFKLSSLAQGILFANFNQFSLGKGILFGNLGQRNVKLR